LKIVLQCLTIGTYYIISGTASAGRWSSARLGELRTREKISKRKDRRLRHRRDLRCGQLLKRVMN